MALAAKKLEEGQKLEAELKQSINVVVLLQAAVSCVQILNFFIIEGLWAVGIASAGLFACLGIWYWLRQLDKKREANAELMREMMGRIEKHGENAYGGPIPTGTDEKEWQGFFEESLEELRPETERRETERRED